MFDLLAPQVLVQLNRIPYFEYELGWVVPSIVFLSCSSLLKNQELTQLVFAKLASTPNHRFIKKER